MDIWCQNELRLKLARIMLLLGHSKFQVAKSIGITRVTLNRFLAGNRVDLRRHNAILRYVHKKELALNA